MTVKKKMIWEILNSNLFLWLMGAIVLSLIPFIYSEWKSSSEKADRIERMDYEMENRLNQLFDNFSRGIDSTEYLKSYGTSEKLKSDSVNVKQLLFEFKKPPKETYSPKF